MSRPRTILIVIFFAAGNLLPMISRSATVPGLKTSPNLLVNEQGRWVVVAKGIEFRNIALQRGDSNQPLELKLLRFDPQIVVPRVLTAAQFQSKATDAKTFVEKAGALAAVNANYFDEQGRP